MNHEPSRPQDPLRFFTFAGRLLFLATLLLSGGLFAWIVLYGKDRVPTGTYPLAFILIPVVIGAAIFFILAELLLRLLGIRVWTKADDANIHQSVQPHVGPAKTPANPGSEEGPPH